MFVNSQLFLEQKKMLKTGLNIAHFKKHVEVIEEETQEYFKRWGRSGERGNEFKNNSVCLNGLTKSA